jgi:hypothetical protein
MSDPLRITGDNPSPEFLRAYPNWEHALDEEHEEGQDETTIRPSEDQSVIGECIPFTAATVWLNNGHECPAFLEMVNGVAGLDLYLGAQWYRLVRHVDRFNQFERWEPYIEEWLIEEERSPSLALSDTTVFPLRLASRLPYYVTLVPIRIIIAADGSEETWD